MTSSGTTAGFETYDFDYKLSSVTIAAVFSGPQESITISEVRKPCIRDKCRDC